MSALAGRVTTQASASNRTPESFSATVPKVKVCGSHFSLLISFSHLLHTAEVLICLFPLPLKFSC